VAQLDTASRMMTILLQIAIVQCVVAYQVQLLFLGWRFQKIVSNTLKENQKN